MAALRNSTISTFSDCFFGRYAISIPSTCGPPNPDGTLSNAVTRRTNEIGIRLALGARSATVIRMFMQETGWIVAAGLLVGFAGAFIATRAISSMLFGLSPTDPSTFIFAGMLLVASAASAAYIPARRASRVDPVIALRHE